jgi:RNA-binding protein
MKLSNKQKQFLKAEGHALKPVVLLGANGLTEGVLLEIVNALEIHELIKVKVPTSDRETKALIFEAIVRETSAVKLQTIGHNIMLYKPSKEKIIQLPKI